MEGDYKPGLPEAIIGSLIMIGIAITFTWFLFELFGG